MGAEVFECPMREIPGGVSVAGWRLVWRCSPAACEANGNIVLRLRSVGFAKRVEG